LKKTILFALMGLAPAFAATNPPCTTTLTGVVISGPLDVPAGQTCTLIGTEVTGPLTVEEALNSFGTRFDASVMLTAE
jgi:hypothetical protein